MPEALRAIIEGTRNDGLVEEVPPFAPVSAGLDHVPRAVALGAPVYRRRPDADAEYAPAAARDVGRETLPHENRAATTSTGVR